MMETLNNNALDAFQSKPKTSFKCCNEKLKDTGNE